MLFSVDISFYIVLVNINCSFWNVCCCIMIYYQEYIQLLWEYLCDNFVSDGNLVICICCYNCIMGLGNFCIFFVNLELIGEVDGINGVCNCVYIDLFFVDVEMVVDGSGGVIDCIQEELCLDENGDLVLDDMNNLIIDIVLCLFIFVSVMSFVGVMSFLGFFDKFEVGVSYDGYMILGELRLIVEWLDIGG